MLYFDSNCTKWKWWRLKTSFGSYIILSYGPMSVRACCNIDFFTSLVLLCICPMFHFTRKSKRYDAVVWQPPLKRQTMHSQSNTKTLYTEFDYATITDRLRTVTWIDNSYIQPVWLTSGLRTQPSHSRNNGPKLHPIPLVPFDIIKRGYCHFIVV